MKKTLLLFLFLMVCMEAQTQPINYAANQVALLENIRHNYEQMTGWVILPLHLNLKEGDHDHWILQLKNNLALTGDYKPNSDARPFTNTFDLSLTEALKKFQQRHGHIANGILNKHTLDELNIPPTSRIVMLNHAIEKWRRLADNSSPTFLLVNIPDFSLNIIDSGSVIQSMKVILGDLKHPTPEFESEINGLTIRPTWVVPRHIFIDEILPKAKIDPTYLTKQNMLLYTYIHGAKILVNPDTVHWNNIKTQDIHYQAEQIPGPWNPLGNIKFTLPSSCQICLHDTPQKNLFQYIQRSFSHGCIRVENANDLAAWLLKKSNDEIEELIEDSQNDTFFYLSSPICLYVGYFASWVAEDGSIQFRKDFYHSNTHREALSNIY